MNADETILLLSQPDFLEKLYGFAYSRCLSAHEAEDLCSDIVLAVIRAVRRGTVVGDFYPFAWTVAHRVYADFAESRSRDRKRVVFDGGDMLNILAEPASMEDGYADVEDDCENLRLIRREIAFLSKIYRDVTVLYYLEGCDVRTVALRLGISAGAVKQRLLVARETIKKEINKMDERDLAFRPVHLVNEGNGDPNKSYPFSTVSQRSLSMNAVYLCRDRERSAKEIADILSVPTVFVEQELAIQARGSNGEDGLIKKLDNGKYISTYPIIDIDAYDEIQNLLKSRVSLFTDRVIDYVDKRRDEILAIPYLSEQTDLRFILWPLVNDMSWTFGSALNNVIIKRFYPDYVETKKDYYPYSIAVESDRDYSYTVFGCDGILADNLCGYKNIHITNMYEYRRLPMNAHFHCEVSIADTPYLMLTLRSIGGLNVNDLSESDAEAAAKAIEQKYVRRVGDILEPNILAFNSEDYDKYRSIAWYFEDYAVDFAEKIAPDFNALIKKRLPKHLYGDLTTFITHSTTAFAAEMVLNCVDRGILTRPDPICAEGSCIIVTR